MAITDKAQRKSTNPWLVLVGAGLAGAVTIGPIMASTLGIFVVPITTETGWNRTTVTGAYSVAAIAMAISMPVMGRVLDVFAARWVAIPSFVLLGLFTASISLTPPDSTFLYYVPYFLMGLFSGGANLPLYKAVVSWFDNKRGLALGLFAGFMGIGVTLSPLVAQLLIDAVGWRMAYVGLGAIIMVISLPMVVGVVRVRGERSARGRLLKEAVVEDRVVNLESPGLTFTEALKSRFFWMITISLAVAGIGIIGLQINLVPLMMDRGMDAASAALLLSIWGGTTVFGRVVGGFLLDRIHGTVLGAVVLVLPAAGIFLLHEPFIVAAIAAACIGIATGIEYDLLNFFVTRYLGTKAFGTILGVASAAVLVGTSFGPILLGLAFDITGSYDVMMPVLAVLFVLCALVVLSLGRYRYAAVAGFDKLAAEDELAATEVLAATDAVRGGEHATQDPLPQKLR